MKLHDSRSLTDDASELNGTIPGIHVTSVDEGRTLFEGQVQKTLQMSGEEFLRRWDHGEYRPLRDDAQGRQIQRLVMLIPFVRSSHA